MMLEGQGRLLPADKGRMVPMAALGVKVVRLVDGVPLEVVSEAGLEGIFAPGVGAMALKEMVLVD